MFGLKKIKRRISILEDSVLALLEEEMVRKMNNLRSAVLKPENKLTSTKNKKTKK